MRPNANALTPRIALLLPSKRLPPLAPLRIQLTNVGGHAGLWVSGTLPRALVPRRNRNRRSGPSTFHLRFGQATPAGWYSVPEGTGGGLNEVEGAGGEFAGAARCTEGVRFGAFSEPFPESPASVPRGRSTSTTPSLLNRRKSRGERRCTPDKRYRRTWRRRTRSVRRRFPPNAVMQGPADVACSEARAERVSKPTVAWPSPGRHPAGTARRAHDPGLPSQRRKAKDGRGARSTLSGRISRGPIPGMG